MPGDDGGNVSVVFGDGSPQEGGTTVFTHAYAPGFTTSSPAQQLTITIGLSDTTYNVQAAADVSGSPTLLTGTAGNDLLIANPHATANTLDGGSGGDDVLYGSTAAAAKADTFVFAPHSGHDVVVNFGAEDFLDISQFGVSDVADFMNTHAVDTAAGALITFDADTSVPVQSALKAHIDQSHVLNTGGAYPRPAAQGKAHVI